MGEISTFNIKQKKTSPEEVKKYMYRHTFRVVKRKSSKKWSKNETKYSRMDKVKFKQTIFQISWFFQISLFQIFILSSVRSEFNSLDKPVFVSFALLKLKLSLIRQVVVFYSFFLENISTCIDMSSLWNNFSAQIAIAQNLTINIERWKLSPCLALN